MLCWNGIFKDDILSIVDATRRTGLYGGVIGGHWDLLVTRLKKPISLAGLAVYVPLGQAIGRWGNFSIRGFGNNTTLPWGMISNQTSLSAKRPHSRC